MKLLTTLTVLLLISGLCSAQSVFRIYLNKNGQIQAIDESFKDLELSIDSKAEKIMYETVENKFVRISIPILPIDSNSHVILSFSWKKCNLKFDCSSHISNGAFKFDQDIGIAFCYFTNKKKLAKYIKGCDVVKIDKNNHLPIFVTASFHNNTYYLEQLDASKRK